MKKLLYSGIAILALLVTPAASGEAEIKAAQSTIEGQLQAFLSDDGASAYSFAAPNVKRFFPTVETFMTMVERGYKPVHRPQQYSFGRSREMSPGSIVQEVLIVGPAGKNWVAIYTLQQQPDGVFRITGVSLRGSNALST